MPTLAAATTEIEGTTDQGWASEGLVAQHLAMQQMLNHWKAYTPLDGAESGPCRE
jgi:hypothetical protein